MKVQSISLVVLCLGVLSLSTAVADDHAGAASDAGAEQAAVPAVSEVADTPFSTLPEEHKGHKHRCDTVGNVTREKTTTVVGLEVKITPKIPVGKVAEIEAGSVSVGMHRAATQTKESQLAVKFCIESDDSRPRFKDAEGDLRQVQVTAEAGFLECTGKVKVAFETQEDENVEFFGLGYSQGRGGEHFWETETNFLVQVGAGIPQSELAAYCQRNAEFGRMLADADRNAKTAQYVMKQYSENIQCVRDRECPTPRSTGALGYDLSHLYAKRCIYYRDRETKELAETKCQNLSKEGTLCSPDNVGMGDEQGSCDFGLKCAYSHVEWFPEHGPAFVYRYKCEK